MFMRLLKLFSMSFLLIHETFACTRGNLEAIKSGRGDSCNLLNYEKVSEKWHHTMDAPSLKTLSKKSNKKNMKSQVRHYLIRKVLT